MPEPYRQIGVRMSPNMHRQLKALAKAKNTTVSKLMRQILDERLSQEGFR